MTRSTTNVILTASFVAALMVLPLWALAEAADNDNNANAAIDNKTDTTPSIPGIDTSAKTAVESQTTVKADGSVKTTKHHHVKRRVTDATDDAAIPAKPEAEKPVSHINETSPTGLADEGKANGSRKVDAGSSIDTHVDK